MVRESARMTTAFSGSASLADSAGSQFFVMDGKSPHLDGGYAVFGKCGPDAVVEKLASVPVQGEQSVNPTKIKSIQITRGK